MHIKNTILRHGVRHPTVSRPPPPGPSQRLLFNAKSCNSLWSRIDQYKGQLQAGRSQFDFQHGQEIFFLATASTPIRRSHALQRVTKTAKIHLAQKVEEKLYVLPFPYH